jgi:hypothetical protein
MPVIPVNKEVDPKRIIGKMEGRGGGEAQGVADQKKLVGENSPNLVTLVGIDIVDDRGTTVLVPNHYSLFASILPTTESINEKSVIQGCQIVCFQAKNPKFG